MKSSALRSCVQSVPSLGAAIRQSLCRRLRGPGGLYNLGNLIGFLSGAVIAVQDAGASGRELSARLFLNYLAGSEAALMLTAATVVFFFSGEVYHRAFQVEGLQQSRLIRTGDLLSALGAGFLGIALALLGHPVLATTSGLLHGLGKLGSALHEPGAPLTALWPPHWMAPLRLAVVVSRVPAVLAASADLAHAAAHSGSLLAPLTLLICYLLWAIADILLLIPKH